MTRSLAAGLTLPALALLAAAAAAHPGHGSGDGWNPYHLLAAPEHVGVLAAAVAVGIAVAGLRRLLVRRRR